MFYLKLRCLYMANYFGSDRALAISSTFSFNFIVLERALSHVLLICDPFSEMLERISDEQALLKSVAYVIIGRKGASYVYKPRLLSRQFIHKTTSSLVIFKVGRGITV